MKSSVPTFDEVRAFPFGECESGRSFQSRVTLPSVLLYDRSESIPFFLARREATLCRRAPFIEESPYTCKHKGKDKEKSSPFNPSLFGALSHPTSYLKPTFYKANFKDSAREALGPVRFWQSVP